MEPEGQNTHESRDGDESLLKAHGVQMNVPSEYLPETHCEHDVLDAATEPGAQNAHSVVAVVTFRKVSPGHDKQPPAGSYLNRPTAQLVHVTELLTKVFNATGQWLQPSVCPATDMKLGGHGQHCDKV